MKVYPLFSGSSGNSIYIEFDSNNGILVDAGRSTKQIEKKLNDNNICIKNIKAIFLTHEHSDHVSGLKIFAMRYGIKIYTSSGTINALKNKGILNDKMCCQNIEKKEVDLKFALVNSFSISHDCAEGFGYVFTSVNGQKIALCTDLGYISDEIKSSIKGCETVIIESNHDVMMLQNGPYPYYLKRRILSNSGHLSNESCSEILPFLVESGTKNIMLSHLSSHNNVPHLALQTALHSLSNQGMMQNKDFYLSVLPKENLELTNFSI